MKKLNIRKITEINKTTVLMGSLIGIVLFFWSGLLTLCKTHPEFYFNKEITRLHSIE